MISDDPASQDDNDQRDITNPWSLHREEDKEVMPGLERENDKPPGSNLTRPLGQWGIRSGLCN